MLITAALATLAMMPTTAPVDDTRTRDSLKIAGQFWGTTACTQAHHVYKADMDVEGLTFGTRYGCTIWMHSDLWRFNTPWERALYCTDLVHEVGHVIGYQHDTNPASVMVGNGDIRMVRGCVKRFRLKYRGPYAQRP